MIKSIEKRDGRIMPFNPQKIVDAILKAMKQCDICDIVIATEIANKIANSKNIKTIPIEKVQDMVEVELMKSEYPEVAKEYITYRDKRTDIRRRNSKLNRRVSDAIMCKNIQNQNANLDEHSFGGRKNEAAGVLLKDLALNGFMREEIAEAHKQNEIYNHDLSEYILGSHNCIFPDLETALKGFNTRNGDVREAGNFATACQLIAVIFQCSSQTHFGGIAAANIDYDLVPYVRKSFIKHYKDGLKYVDHRKSKNWDDFEWEVIDKMANHAEDNFKELLLTISIDDDIYKKYSPSAYSYAYDMLEKEGSQSAQGLYHNLNTLESRPGAQLPFTSINSGRNTTVEGRLINKWIFNASIDGIGKFHQTPIFPISIFKYKKGVNDKPGTPNYDLKLLAIKSLSKRIYPNIVNCDWSQNVEDPNDPDTFMGTMGCRTLVGYDRHGMGYSKKGRGNACPVTINLPKIGIKYGICLNKRKKPDVKGFFKELNRILMLTETALVDRFYHICDQSVKSGMFMYENGIIADSKKALERGVYESMKHFTLAMGYIGVAEMCRAMYGYDHADGVKEVEDFAEKVIKTINEYAKKASDRHNLNFGCYATPAENLTKTYCEALKAEFGEIKNITDRGYLTNSHHVSVWKQISIYDKLRIEAKYCKYATSGCITYVELDSSIMNNLKAIEDIIDYAMSLDIPYLAFNFPIDTCTECGYQGEIENLCPKCKGANIQRLRRVTGYLSVDYHKFNEGKIKEVQDRVRHSDYTDFTKFN